MERYHPLRELAPRDVVARAIVTEMRRTGTPHAFLDLRHLSAAFLRKRFPRIFETCAQFGVDIGCEPIPVRPAAHYAMGGVRTDLDGRTSLSRLFAAGEVACTGVHGANRLASNSLLEGVVFGARAGRAMRETIGDSRPAEGRAPHFEVPQSEGAEIRAMAWNYCGILRCGDGLREAIARLEALDKGPAEFSCERAEARNIWGLALLIARCALAREESRGAHFRTDFSAKRPEFEKHSVISKDAGIRFD
jgi:L-aspartate oxidase